MKGRMVYVSNDVYEFILNMGPGTFGQKLKAMCSYYGQVNKPKKRNNYRFSSIKVGEERVYHLGAEKEWINFNRSLLAYMKRSGRKFLRTSKGTMTIYRVS